MNRIHRVVWSECRKAFIVAGEHAKAKGKPSSSTRKAVASAVVMALAAMAAEPAMAGTPGATVSTGVYSNGSNITGTGTGAGLLASGNVTSISNSGTITGGPTGGAGIYLQSNSTVTGGINNSGTISGGVSGIKIQKQHRERRH